MIVICYPIVKKTFLEKYTHFSAVLIRPYLYFLLLCSGGFYSHSFTMSPDVIVFAEDSQRLVLTMSYFTLVQ